MSFLVSPNDNMRIEMLSGASRPLLMPLDREVDILYPLFLAALSFFCNLFWSSLRETRSGQHLPKDSSSSIVVSGAPQSPCLAHWICKQPVFKSPLILNAKEFPDHPARILPSQIWTPFLLRSGTPICVSLDSHRGSGGDRCGRLFSLEVSKLLS